MRESSGVLGCTTRAITTTARKKSTLSNKIQYNTFDVLYVNLKKKVH